MSYSCVMLHAVFCRRWRLRWPPSCRRQTASLLNPSCWSSRGGSGVHVCVTHPMCCHQDGEGRWNKFGGRLPWGPEAICSNNAVFGGKGSQKQGEDYTAAPNIDHSQQRVKDDIKAWMKWLRSSIGFDGWRFDFVKGYRAPYARLVQPAMACLVAVWHGGAPATASSRCHLAAVSVCCVNA